MPNNPAGVQTGSATAGRSQVAVNSNVWIVALVAGCFLLGVISLFAQRSGTATGIHEIISEITRGFVPPPTPKPDEKKYTVKKDREVASLDIVTGDEFTEAQAREELALRVALKPMKSGERVLASDFSPRLDPGRQYIILTLQTLPTLVLPQPGTKAAFILQDSISPAGTSSGDGGKVAGAATATTQSDEIGNCMVKDSTILRVGQPSDAGLVPVLLAAEVQQDDNLIAACLTTYKVAQITLYRNTP